MSFEHIQRLLDTTAGDLVTADYDSAQDMIALSASLEALRDTAADIGLLRIPNAFNRAIELINTIATDSACERSSAIETLNKLFSAIQYALRPGSDPEKLRLPAGTMRDFIVHTTGSEAPTDKPFSLPDYLDRDLFSEFINDQDSVLSSAEEQLLKLEHDVDAESINDLKRIFHTLKGEAGVFELRKVERLCHSAEDLIESNPDSVPVDVLLTIKDWLKDCFEALKHDQPVPPFSSDILSIQLQSTDSGDSDETAEDFTMFLPPSDALLPFELSPFIAPEIFKIFIDEQECELEKMGSLIERLEHSTDMEAIAGLKQIFHTLNGGSGVCGLTDVERLCCNVEDVIEKNPAILTYDSLLEIRQWLKQVFDALKTEKPLPVLSDSVLAKVALPLSWHPGDVCGDKDQATEIFFDDAIFSEFIDEQQSVITTIESLILQFEKQPDNDIQEELKRVFHTLKGEARVFGLLDIEKLCHTVEDLIDHHQGRLRCDALYGVKDYLARCFKALKQQAPMPELTDQMLGTLAMAADSYEMDSEVAAVVYNPLKGAVTFKAEPDDTKPVGDNASDKQDLGRHLLTADLDLLSDFVSEVKEHIDNINDCLLSLENNPGDSDLLNAVFRVFHTIKGAAGFMALDEISRLAHITESLLDSARKGDLLLKDGSIDIVFEAVDEMKCLVGTIEKALSSGENTFFPSTTVDRVIEKIKMVLDPNYTPAVEQTRGTDKDPVGVQPDITTNSGLHPTIPADPIPMPPQSPAESLSSSTEPISEGTECEADEFLQILYENEDEESEKLPANDNRLPSQQQRVKIKESIKVDAENLDKLIDAIGELVIIEAMIRQDSTIRVGASSTLLRNITQMDKITRELQTLGMSLRMIPIKATFQKMARVVRDLAKKSEKKIEFISRGDETMLDKSVVDRISDPLIHLVRNAVDHGIEPTHEDRRRNNKNPIGRISLTAFHKGGNIYVEIKDDGRGLNRESIRKKALEKGLTREGQQLTDNEIYNLILLPGFSTARKVTEVSGRGVGMDVVKRTIEDLRGNIDILSEAGKGTTISLRLPLTLAIIDGMLVRIGEERYIIPTLSIVESVRPRVEDISTVINKGEMIMIRDSLIPLFRLADLFKIKAASQRIEDSIVIVVEDSGRMTGIMVDELLGQQSTVIKNLGALKGLTGISGGSIMTDGSVGIILDVGGIVKLATAKKNIEKKR